MLAAIHFPAISVVVLATSWLVVRHRIQGRLDQILAWFTLAVTQVVLTMLLAGTVFSLTAGTLWILNLAALGLALATRIRTRPTAPSKSKPGAANDSGRRGVSTDTLGPPVNHAQRRSPKAPGPSSGPGMLSHRETARYGTAAKPTLMAPTRLRGHLWAQVLLALALGEVAWLVFLGYLFPEMAWDSLYYHLPAVVTWIKEQRLVLTPYNLWTNIYPMNTELLMAWTMIFTGGETIVDLVQLPFAIAGSLATYGLGRRVGLPPANSAVAGCLFFLTPIVLVQSKTAYVDVAFAGFFLVAFYFGFSYFLSHRRCHYWLAGVATGVLMGMKASALAYAAVVFLLVLAGSFQAARREGKRIWAYGLRDAGFFAVTFLVGGSFWYLRNWLSYGNPLFPFTFKLLGITVWPGQGSIDELIMQANTPPSFLGLPTWKQLGLSWLESPVPYSFDQRIGGLGPQWLWLEFPALLLTIGWAVVRRKPRLLWLLLPLALLFMVQPSNWWSRYTIFIVAAGAVSVAYLESSLPRSHAPVLRAYTLALVVVSLTLSFTHNYYPLTEVRRFLALPPSQRTFFQLDYHRKPWGREMAWVETIPAGSKIAMTEARFPYLLFGPKLDNQVQVLVASSPHEMLRHLRDSGAQFFFTSQASQYHLWAKKWPQVVVRCYAANDFITYAVDRGRLASLSLP